MYSVRKAVFDLEDVPVEWVFENYLKLNERLRGQDVKMKSLFNPSDRNPSMYVYMCRNSKSYKFKCFSTGLQGSAVNLIMHLKSLDFAEAAKIIMEDYRKFIETGEYARAELKMESKWKLDSYNLRSWNQHDAAYWSPYNIGSNMLEKYNVKPIASYVMHKDGIESFERKARRIYGYFNKHDELCKIYQPEAEDKKFLVIKNYIQGWDQLQGKERLFICSSLKDIMSLDSLNVDADFIAPSSEIAGLEIVMDFIQEYPEKYVIFDNDAVGIKMMQRYQEVYNLPYIHIPLSKDISDSVRDFGASKVKSYIKQLSIA